MVSSTIPSLFQFCPLCLFPAADEAEHSSDDDDEEFEEGSKMDACYEDFFDPPEKVPVVRKSRNGEEEGMERARDEEGSEDVGREEWEESEDGSVERDGEEVAQVIDETEKESLTAKDKLSSFEKSQKKVCGCVSRLWVCLQMWVCLQTAV